MLTEIKKWYMPKSRRASVLVLVVVLLLLLALMGTAYIVSTRMDSAVAMTSSGAAGPGNAAYDPAVFAAATNTLTTLVQARIFNDLFSTAPTQTTAVGNYRQPITNYSTYTAFGTMGSGGFIYDSTGKQVLPFVASAIPVAYPMQNDLLSVPSGLAGLVPVWPAISSYLAWPGVAMDFQSPLSGAYGVNANPTLLCNAQPSAMAVSGMGSSGSTYRVFPALRLSNGTLVFAADASGCGIADAGLFPLTDPLGNPLVDANGVKYYAAWKCVDNNAIININTAWCRNGDVPFPLPASFNNLTTPGALNPNFGFFRTNIGLYEMFGGASWSDTEFTNWDTFRIPGVNTTAIPAPPGRTDFSYLSAGDALEMGLARRAANPGTSPFLTTANFRPFSQGGQAALAYHIALFNPNGNLTDVDNYLANSTYYNARNFISPADPYKPYLGYKFYPPDLAVQQTYSAFPGWFSNHFNQEASVTAANNWTGNFNGLRGFITPNSAESNYVQAHAMGGLPAGVVTLALAPGAIAAPIVPGQPEAMPNLPATLAIPRASLNTASFGELWRAYWNVMVEDLALLPGGILPSPVQPKGGTTAMFRSSLRGATQLLGPDMVLLRAAAAAANTETLRMNAANNNITMHQITLSGGRAAYVYGTRKQVYLTECFVYVDPIPANNYIAIELFNPYATQLNVKGWQLATLNRANMTLAAIASLDSLGQATIAGTTTAAPSLLVIEAGVRPANAVANVVPQGTVVQCPGLLNAIGQELVILRPIADGGTITNINDPTTAAPIDSIDLSAVPATLPVGALVGQAWDYARPNDPVNSAWEWVFPGVMNGGVNTALQSPPTINPNSRLGQMKTATTAGTQATTATLPQVPPIVPVCLAGWPSPNPIAGATGNVFPFGGFARNADVLQVTYFGGYQIFGIECNSVTQDCGFANDPNYTPTATQPPQQIGRFCSLGSLAYMPPPTPPTLPSPPPTTYDWAERIFDYVTAIQNPHDDYFPAVPNANHYLNSANYPTYNYSATNPPNTTPEATSVPNIPINGSASANLGYEDGVPIQGRININTAPWQVLNMLPLVVNPATGTVDATTIQNNARLAYAIALYRSQNGPFKTIFDLNKVPGFQNAMGTLAWPMAGLGQAAVAEGDITMADGSFPKLPASGSPAATAAPLLDFRPQYYQITRLSNLVTTRSDTFTCYLLVQGWKGSQLVVEQRTSFVIDRTGVNNSNNTTKALNILSVPNQ